MSTAVRSQPTMHGFPICRATSAACAVRPPTAVTMPADNGKPRDIGGVGIGTHEDDRIAAAGQLLGGGGVEGGTPARDARRCADASRDGIVGVEQALAAQRVELDSVESAKRLRRG